MTVRFLTVHEQERKLYISVALGSSALWTKSYRNGGEKDTRWHSMFKTCFVCYFQKQSECFHSFGITVRCLRIHEQERKLYISEALGSSALWTNSFNNDTRGSKILSGPHHHFTFLDNKENTCHRD